MAIIKLALIIMSVSNILGEFKQDIEGRVVEGEYSDIKDFGYAAYLRILCETVKDAEPIACGASILNQAILITAAHCLNDCGKSSFITVNVGNVHKRKGIQNSALNFITHEEFEGVGMGKDIALIKLKDTLQFGDNLKRVVLMKHPPRVQYAVVGGWGLTDELEKTREKVLKYTKQRIWTHEDCSDVIDDLPEGIICAGEKNARSYASFGDSGGALVVNKYIQIGVVSYKIASVSRSLAVYTNVSFFYGWIERTSKKLHCLN